MMIFTLMFALAAGAQQPPATLPPADPTALFQGNGKPIKFDPACRDYTLETLPTDPPCAARVAALEAGPVLAIAARTLIANPKQAPAAVALLERALEKTDHPALHYFLGSVLRSGEHVAPNYQKAVRHLTIAAAGKNPAAADLLATLILLGKGTPRDIPRAISLFRQAAENGFPLGAVNLGRLYLDGRYLPKDRVLGLAWLKVAAAAGEQRAEYLVGAADKIKNFQIFPAADPAKVKVVQFDVFDNPDIPPNFGFDEPFQKAHFAPFDDSAVLATLEQGYRTMPTPYLFELSRRLITSDVERARRIFLLAYVRMRYDTLRCEDPAAQEATGAWVRLMSADQRFLLSAGIAAKDVDATLTEEATFPGDASPWWVCRSGLNEYAAVAEGKVKPLRLKPKSDWPQLREQARSGLREQAKPKTP